MDRISDQLVQLGIVSATDVATATQNGRDAESVDALWNDLDNLGLQEILV